MSIPKMPRSKRPVSARGMPSGPAANRANAARSTGPRTPEGKARSAQNARRHSFAAADFAVFSLEDLQAVAHLKDDLVAVCQPVNSQELFAIECMALAQPSLLRAARPGRPLWPAGLFTCCLDDAVDSRGEDFIPLAEALVGDLEVTPGQDHNFALAHGFSSMVQRGNTWALFLRHQAQMERRGAPWVHRRWRNSSASKRCAANYRTKPIPGANPLKTQTLRPRTKRTQPGRQTDPRRWVSPRPAKRQSKRRTTMSISPCQAGLI